jgi:hypothetical protein
MTTMFETYYRCPQCGTAFQSTTIGSCGHADKWSDLCPDFWGASPRMFFVACCPGCGYCDFTNEFEDMPPETETDVTDPGGDVLDRYVKAYEHALSRKKPARHLADYAVQVAWCRHDEDDDADSPALKKYREAVVFHFEEALGEGEVEEEEMPIIHYLIAEFSRQNGDFEKAKTHLDKIPDDAAIAETVPLCRKHVEAGDSEPYRLGEEKAD